MIPKSRMQGIPRGLPPLGTCTKRHSAVKRGSRALGPRGVGRGRGVREASL